MMPATADITERLVMTSRDLMHKGKRFESAQVDGELQMHFLPSGDRFRICTNSVALLDLAASLWEKDSNCNVNSSEPFFRLQVRDTPTSRLTPETDEEWHVHLPRVDLRLGDHLAAHLDFQTASVEGRVSARLLRDQPSLVARLLLEAPAAQFLSSRGWQVLHAAAIAGPKGAVVVRGGNGAGKSTLAAAAWQSGLILLGDESVLASKKDGSQISVTVHELVLRPDSAHLLGLHAQTIRTWNGSEEKRRVPMTPPLTPAQRQAEHLATVLLGDRNTGDRAFLLPLEAEEFRKRFQEGRIPQEDWFGNTDELAGNWARKPAYLLEGHSDLSGAAQLIASLVGVGGTRNERSPP